MAADKQQANTKREINLSVLAPRPGARKKRKRLGIGEGSGNGKTCGKGQKGQRSRSGFSLPAGFEGGQMPIHRRLPKRGFVSRKKTIGSNRYNVISLGEVATVAKKIGSTNVTFEALCEAGLVNPGEQVKLLAGGEFSGKVKVHVHAVSAAALAAVTEAGGQVELIQRLPATEER